MSEFTKEELNMLYQSAMDRQINLSQGLMKPDITYKHLINKLKFMIHNYNKQKTIPTNLFCSCMGFCACDDYYFEEK